MQNSLCIGEEMFIHIEKLVFMKIIKLHFIVLLFAIVTACNNNKDAKMNEDEFEIIVHDELIIGEFDLYDADPLLYPIFDSLVRAAEVCPQLKKRGLIYSMSIYKDNDSLTRVHIEQREQKRMYCKSIYKVYYYKGLLFNIVPDNQFSKWFTKTGLKVKFICQKGDDFNFTDAFTAIWGFVIEDDKIKCISYGYCNNHWENELYYRRDSIANTPFE